MTRPLKVLQVVDTLSMGGAETWLMEVLRRVSRTGGLQMDFLLTSGQPGIFDEEARALGARLYYVRFGRDNLCQFLKTFRGILGSGNYDAIHDHQDRASAWHYLTALGLLPAVRVTHIHNPAYQIQNIYGTSPLRTLMSSVAQALTRRLATHIVGTSAQILREYRFRPGRGATIAGALHCGFDTDRFNLDRGCVRDEVLAELDLPKTSKIVLFAGRMDESPHEGDQYNHKNSRFAVEVAIEALKLDSDLRFLFAGKVSAALPELEARIAGAGLSKQLRFLDTRLDIERLMAASDVFFFPSRGEGLGMVAVEAQAAGVPVLASTAVPSECVAAPGLVWFRNLADDKVSWAKDLIRLCGLPKDTPAANAAVKSSAFSIHQSVRALLDIYGSGARR